jgi:hypothetical protein
VITGKDLATPEQGQIVENPEQNQPTLLSLRAYARRRGCSAVAVLRAVTKGRLRRSVVYVDGTPQIADPDLADEEWAANTDLTKAPTYVKQRAARKGQSLKGEQVSAEVVPMTPGPNMAQAALDEKRWKARLAEQEFLRQAGNLVDGTAAKSAFMTQVIEARTKLLGVPSKVKGRVPELTLAQLAVIDEEIRRALEEIGG